MIFTKIVIIFLITAFITGLFFIILENPLEFFLLDLRFLFIKNQYNPFDISSEIVLITIDEASEKAMNIPLEGSLWRQYDPLIIDTLVKAGAAVIIYDIHFKGESPAFDPGLALAFSRAGRIITGEPSNEDGSTSRILAPSIYKITSPSVTVKYGMPRIVDKNKKSEALSFAAASAFASFLREKGFVDQALKIEKYINRMNLLYINYSYPPSFFPVFSYFDVLNSKDDRLINPAQTPLSVFKNKIVLVAKDFSKDTIHIPNSPGMKYFGGLVHAFAIQTLVNGQSVLKIDHWLNALILLLFLAAVQLLFLYTNRIKRAAVIILVFLIHWFCCLGILQAKSLWIDSSGFYISMSVLILMNVIYKRRLLAKNFEKIKMQILSLENYNKMLEQSGELQNVLTDSIVHDIKNSISAVEGTIEYLSRKYADDKYNQEIFNAANTACCDIVSLSSNLLDSRKIEEGKMDILYERISFSNISDIIANHAGFSLFNAKAIKVEIIPPDFDFFISADRYLLEQIIHNLLNNDLKYTPNKGQVKIFFKRSEPGNIISFYNSGPPIPASQHELIFNKYLRLGKERSKYSKGLGLYFCKRSMEIQNGRIVLETDKTGNYFNLMFNNQL